MYNSNQIEKADAEFKKLLAWAETNSTHGYAFLVGFCYQEKLLYYKNDATQLQAIWKAAIKHSAVNMQNDFPYAEPVQNEIIIAADKLELTELKTYLTKIISTQRKLRNIPDAVNKIIVKWKL